MTSRPANIIRHKHTRAFTVIANDVLNDPRLSLDEKGLLCWFLSLPEDWEIIPAHVRKTQRLGREKYHRIMKSLRTAGYAELQIERAEDGTIACVRYVVSDKPASPAAVGDAPAVPDERVCEIEDAELEAADDDEDTHPRPEKPYDGSADYGKPDSRESNIDLENNPPTPQPSLASLPLPPPSTPPPSFRALCAKWPSDRIVSASAAEKRFLRLSEDRRRLAFDGVDRYLAENRSRGWKICDLQTYLRERRFEVVKGAPAPAFAIHGGTPQAFRWLGYRRSMGEPTSFMEECWRQGKPWYAPTEWPPPIAPKTVEAAE